MFFRSEYINKAVSSVLLVALLLIHSVKLLHSHPGNSFASNDIHKNSSVVKSGSDCSVCNYQLAKDTDNPLINNYEVAVSDQNVFNSVLIASHKNNFYPAFESRGPPARI